MKSKTWILLAFVIVAVAQLGVPAKMIWDREDILKTGTAFKFKTAPIDPSDPFRGKYVALGFEETTISIPNEKDWSIGEAVFVSIVIGEDGFAQAREASKEPPPGKTTYLKTTVDYISYDSSNQMDVNYPFDRYYMEESKAYGAEQTYRESTWDSTAVTYALVHIKNGEAVLKDVMINGESIKEIVARQNNEIE
jgi:uncharacterized membrane-anchored protein